VVSALQGVGPDNGLLDPLKPTILPNVTTVLVAAAPHPPPPDLPSDFEQVDPGDRFINSPSDEHPLDESQPQEPSTNFLDGPSKLYDVELNLDTGKPPSVSPFQQPTQESQSQQQSPPPPTSTSTSTLTPEQIAVDEAYKNTNVWGDYAEPDNLAKLHDLLAKDSRVLRAIEILTELLNKGYITQRAYDRLADKIIRPRSFDSKDPLCWIHPDNALKLLTDARNQIDSSTSEQKKAQAVVRFCIIAEDGGLNALPDVFSLSDDALWGKYWGLLLAIKQLEPENSKKYQDALDALYKKQLEDVKRISTGLASGGPLLALTNYKGVITSGFGMRVHPITGQPRHHDGVDIGAPYDTPVGSAQGGRVTFAGVQGGYGNTVIIDHGNGLTTLYAHLALINVTGGQPVIQGQNIGTVGNTGWSTGPHLHFEVRENGNAVNPLKYFT